MKRFLVLLILLGSYYTQAQSIRFKIANQKDTTVHLVKYIGKSLFYADTAEIKNGVVTFDGKKQKSGILGLYIPGQSILEFVYNAEPETSVEASGPNFMANATAKKSEENKIFFAYVKFMSDKKGEAAQLTAERDKLDKTSAEYKELDAKITGLSKEVESYQERIAKNYDKMLVGQIVKMSMDIKIPDAPKDENGVVLDSSFAFNYFRKHYFDNIDLHNDGLVRTPVFDSKFSYYFSNRMIPQHWDSIIHYAFEFIDRLDPKSDMFQYCVSTLTSTYEKSKIMGMNKVFVYLGKRYYCTNNAEGKSPAHWMTEKQLETLCEKVNTHYNLVMGAVPPNLILRDTTDRNWQDFYSLKSDYTILYFWDPDCGHCKTITPKLQTLYEKKWKDRNIEIFAVGKATGDDFEKWKTFIRKNHLSFINVGVTRNLYDSALVDARHFIPKYTTLESLNYQQTYDIFATPKVWVLDKDKKIIAYSLTISQLEEMLDRLQKKEDEPKLFPPDKDIEQEQMH